MKRRDFLQKMAAGGFVIGTGTFPLGDFSDPEVTKLTILHTNDVHSRIDPFPMDGGRNQGLGGASRRAALVREIRKKEGHLLLLDAGDIFQGTPYFNLFGGELEFKIMSSMGYDAATIGNHDFDAGLEGLNKQLPHADFPFIISNYDFSDTLLAGKTKPYKIFKKGPIKIGVFGLGIALKGLVPESLYGGTRYLDPIEKANYYATILKREEKCDLVICLSHLGYNYREEKVSDMVLAKSTREIDLILGGHTHTFLDKPTIVKNLDGEATMINQVGWAGIMLGKIDLYFERNQKGRCISCKNLLVG
ncbi:MAG: metallophosphatase [Saprospiraceae bacterium]|nr:MAG: metallophosphatase [Saprospiraceae bacterium]